MRETFAVGRVDRKSRAVMWVGRQREPDFPGPWRVRAVVGESGRALEPPMPAAPAPVVDETPAAPEPAARPKPSRPSGTPRPQLDLFA